MASAQLKMTASIILPTLRKCRKKLLALGVSLAFMAISQSFLLLIMGPFIKALFGMVDAQVVKGSELLSPQILALFPAGSDWSISRQELALLIPLAILGTATVRGIAVYIYDLNAAALALFTATSYRIQFFSALMSLEYRHINMRSPARWMSHIMNDVLFLQTRFSDILRSLLQDSIVMFSALVTMWFIHWPTALVLTLLAPIIAKYAGKTGKRISGYAQVYQSELGFLASVLLSIRKRFDFMRSQRGEQLELDYFENVNKNYLKTIRRSIFVRASFAPGMELFGFILFAALLIVVGKMREAHGFEPVHLFVFFAALGVMLRPLRNLGEQLAKFHETMGSLRESIAIFEESRRLSQTQRLLLPPGKQPGVLPLTVSNFQVDVSERCSICSDLPLKIRANKTVAIVGTSGAGKSTLLKCLAGLYRPSKWEASAPWEQVVVRSRFVEQTPFLFEGSLRENIQYGLGEHEDEASLEKSLDRAGVRKEVWDLPARLETRFNPLNTSLSGGQIQRLSVARAVLREADVYLFDEAMASVDAAAEDYVLQQMTDLCRSTKASLLWVTHRLSLLDRFDEIWIVEQGSVIAIGSYDELASQDRFKATLGIIGNGDDC